MEHAIESDRILRFLADRGVTRSRELVEHGFHRVILTRLVTQGKVQRLSRGLYSLPESSPTEWHDLAEISKTTPNAVIGLVSALAFHHIGTQVPYETWIVLPKGAWVPRTRHRVRVTRFDEPYYSAGIEDHQIESVTVRVYCAAKTVADCFRMRNKLGFDVAVEALREGWRDRKFTADDLIRYAKIDRVDRVMRPYIEALFT